jgi:hypothetical protein
LIESDDDDEDIFAPKAAPAKVVKEVVEEPNKAPAKPAAKASKLMDSDSDEFNPMVAKKPAPKVEEPAKVVEVVKVAEVVK